MIYGVLKRTPFAFFQQALSTLKNEIWTFRKGEQSCTTMFDPRAVHIGICAVPHCLGV